MADDFARQMVRAALSASEAGQDGDADASALAVVLCAVHSAFLAGGTAEARKTLEVAARAALDGVAHKDAGGFGLYAGGHAPVPLALPPKQLDRARYIRDRAARALARGDAREQVAQDVAAAVEWAWPVAHQSAQRILTDERVLAAISEQSADGVAEAALRAAGVPANRNRFAADNMKAKRAGSSRLTTKK